MRKLKVSFICILAAVLCCAFALLLLNYSSAFSRAENPSAEITAPEHEAQKTRVSLSYTYPNYVGWDTSPYRQPEGAELSGTFTYQSTTYYGTITVPYTGNMIRLALVGNLNDKVATTLASKPSGYNGTVSRSGTSLTLSSAAPGTYSIRFDGWSDDSGVVNGSGTVQLYGFAVDSSGATNVMSTTLTVIVEGKKISDCTITAPANKTYNGTSQKPKPTIKDGTTTLVENTDYTLTYPSDCINAGSKTVTITGKGKYIGTTTTSFTINRAYIYPTLSYGTLYNNSTASPSLSGSSGGALTYKITSGTDYATINSSGVLTATGTCGTVKVQVTVAQTTNYYATSATATVTVIKRTPSLSLSYGTVTYLQDSAKPTLGGNSGGGTPTYSVANGTGIATIDSTTGVLSPTQAGTVTVSVSVPETTYYYARTQEFTVNIAKATFEPTITYDGTFTFGEDSTAPTVGNNVSGGTPRYSVTSGTGAATINAETGIFTPTRAGTITVTVTVGETTNYVACSASTTVTIGKADITLTLTYEKVRKDVVSKAPTLGGNLGNGSPTYSVTNEIGEATINSSTGVLSPTEVGDIKVTVTVPETTNYFGGTVEITVKVLKAELPLTLSYGTVTYGQDSDAPTLGNNYGNGTPTYSVEGGTGTATIDPTTGVISPTQAGTITVTVTVPETTSYEENSKTITVTIGKADLTLTLTYSTVTFGVESYEPSIGGNLGGGAASYSLANGTGKGTVNATTGTITGTLVGTVTVTVTVEETTNYKMGIGTATVTIEKADLELTLTYEKVHLDVVTKAPVLGGNLGNGTPNYTVANGSGAATINASNGVLTPSAVGTVTVTVTVPATTNYNAGSLEITVTVNKAAITLTLSYPTVTYGQDSETPTVGGNLGNGTPSYSVEGGTGSATIDPATGILTPTQAGTVEVTVTIPETASYEENSKTITVNIEKAKLTLTLTYPKVAFGIESGAPTVGGNLGDGTPAFSLKNGTGSATIDATNGVISPTAVGNVSVTVTVPETTNYKNGSVTVTVTIVKGELNAPEIDYGTVTYGTDSAVPTIKNAGDGVKTFAIAAGTGSATIDENTGVISPTRAGTVTVTLSVSATTNFNAGSYDITVTINKAAISPSFTYDPVTFGKISEEPEITGNLGNTTPEWSVEDGTGIATINALSGVLTPSQAGTVSVTLSLPSSVNYLAGTVTLPVNIKKAKISPQLTYPKVTYSIKSGAPTITGNTEDGDISFIVTNGTGTATIDADTGVLTPTKVGTVTVTLNIAETTNYAAGSADFTVTIGRLTVTEPKFDTASSLNTAGLVFVDDLTAKLVYTGEQVYIAVNCPEGWATSMRAVLDGTVDETLWNTSAGSAFVVSAANALAGTKHKIVISLKNDNFEFAGGVVSVSLTLSVTKQQIALPQFNADDSNNTENLVFSDGNTAATYEYTGNQVYIGVTNIQNWTRYMNAVLSSKVDSASWAASMGGVFLVNANNALGATMHTITFNITDENYVFENEETTVVLTLTINKAQLAVPVFDKADGQNSSGVKFSDGDKSAVIGYTGNDVYLGVTIVDNWALYISAGLSDGLNSTAFAAAEGRAVTVDAADALAGTTYTVTFNITDDNYIFANDETEVILSLNITAKSITEDEITISLDDYSVIYNGLAQVPEVTLEHEGALLAPELDTDFAVKFINTAGLEVAEPTDAGTYTVVVSGLGNYTGESNTIKFVISAASLNDATITLEQDEYGYDGKAKTPEVEVKIDDAVIASTFYSKQYANNINAGTATVTLNGIINFTGNITIEYTIKVRDISVVTFGTLDTKEYTGEAYTPKPAVTDEELGTTLIVGRDFDYTYEDNENAGTAKVIAVAKGNYGGEAIATFEITARDITKVLVGAIENQSFDGRAKLPRPEITDYKIRRTLEEGVDFEYVYENNYDVGVAELYIVGQNNYKGTYVLPFTINARSLEDAEFLSIDTQIYDGYNKTPTANIIENGWTLRRGIDYSISYTDNLNAGEATMTIIGIGNYTGRKSFPFTIYPKAFDNTFDIDGVKPSYVYTGSEISPIPTVTWNGKTLSSTLDYEVSYSDGFNAGTTVLVTVSGKGNYTGSKLVEFTITQATPEVVPEFEDYDGTKSLHAGWGLPDITANVTFNGAKVTGTIAWQKINGEQPKMLDGTHEYGWVFTPTGDSAINFTVVTGNMEVTAEPVDVEKITVTLVGDEEKTYRAFDKFDPTTITVVATLNDGTEIMIPKDYDIIYIDGRDCLWATDTYVTISHLTRGKTVTAQFDQFSVIKTTPTVNLTVDGNPALGDTLGNVSLKFADGDTAGTYEWLAPDAVLDTGVHTFTYKFTPDDAVNYNDYEGSVVINIVVLTDMTVNFYQNSEELFTSDALEELESLINDSTVQLTVKAFYSDDTTKTLTLNGVVDGYTLQIAGSTLTEDGEVTVIFTENGTTLTKTFHAQVTVVKVVRIEAELNADGATVYTDTALDELKDLITVTAHYNNDSSRTVEDFDLTFTDGATKLTHGTATISVDYTGDYKADNCQPVEVEIENVVKHETVLTYEGNTVFTYNGEEQVIDSGAVLNHEQDAHITYTVDGDPAAFTRVPEGGKITVVISAQETEDYYAAEKTVVITVKKAQTVIDTTGVKRTLSYTGKEQTIDGAFILDGEVGAEIVYYNNTFTTVPAGGKIIVTMNVVESENYLGATQKVEVTVEKAKIDVNGAGETLYFTGKKLPISLDEKNEDGTYKNILAVSGENLKITYSQAYKLGEAVIPEPQDEKAYTAFRPEVNELGRYVVNVRITSNDNYETYYGQWLVEVEEEAAQPVAEDGGVSIPLWAIALIAVCAGLSLVAVAVAGVSMRKKPSAAPDSDGFYDDVDEATLASLN